VLLLKVIEDLIRDGFERIDFGFGPGLYKERFGDECRQERSFYIFAPSLRATAVNFAWTVTMASSQLAKRLLRSSGALQMFKTLWKRRLTQNGLHP
jgi:CelD/BcsL family acetyltransferase involved in cellulose biosynthesis